MRYLRALHKVMPDAICLSRDGDTYENIEWQDTRPMPDKPTVEAQLPVVDAEIAQEVEDVEVDDIDLQLSKGFFWLIKHLVQNGTIQVGDIPQKLKDLYDARATLRND